MTRDLALELKALRLHGMAGAWLELQEQGQNAGLDSSRWLLEHLLQAEGTDRAMRSVSHQMHAAKFPMHRDLAGFDFEVSPVDRKLVTTLANMAFTDDAHNVVFVGGPGTGKTHLATAVGVSGITRHGKRVRFYSTVDLVNALEQEKAHGKAGRIAASLLRMDVIVLDELGYLNRTPKCGHHDLREALSTAGRFGRLRRTGTGRRWATRCSPWALCL
ncbi:MAG TPA: ATP-binding protein, partial [Ramlibacter sp.]|nr:ATP-binding protein [Ramlibacter sp.]